MSKLLHLTRGHSVLVDDDFMDELVALGQDESWHACERHGSVYGKRMLGRSPLWTPTNRRFLYEWLHHRILGTRPPTVIDHISGDTRDCTRANLRIASPRGNAQNRRKIPGTSSRYKGVSRNKDKRRWRVSIYAPALNKDIVLGVLESEEEAARCYDVAARMLHGEFARLNFPGECE